MSQEKTTEIRERIFFIERKIKPLEWDSSRNQINEFKKKQLIELQKEFATLKSELSSLENPSD